MLLKRNEMSINGHDITEYNARLLTYSVGSTTFTKDYTNSTNSIIPTVANVNTGTKKLTITLTFKPIDLGNKWYSVVVNKSRLDKLFISCTPVEIALPDGFMYTSICTGITELSPDGTDYFDVTYTFEAIMHEAEIIVTNNDKSNNFFFDVKGNAETSCVIELTPSSKCDIKLVIAKRETGKPLVPAINVFNVEAGNKVVIDTINKTVMVNSENWMLNTDLISFPLLPAEKLSVYVAPSDVYISTSIKYYPTYI